MSDPNQDPEKLLEDYIESDQNFKDNFQTHEQKLRDSEITSLLRQYIGSYADKVKQQRRFRRTLFILCSSIIGAFSIAFLVIAIYSAIRPAAVDVPKVVSLISVCVTFLGSILGLAQIITKYCFPENDEEYITKIVEAIQANDLQNKLANMKVQETSDEPKKLAKVTVVKICKRPIFRNKCCRQ